MITVYNEFVPCHSNKSVTTPNSCQNYYTEAVLRLWKSLREAAEMEHIAKYKREQMDNKLMRIIEEGAAKASLIEDMLNDFGLDYAASSWKHLCFLADIRTDTLYKKPAPSNTHALATDGLDLTSITYLLLRMQRWGFPVDPRLLIRDCLALLCHKKLITDKEVAILWWEREYHRIDPCVNFSILMPEAERGIVHIQSSGYTVAAGSRSLSIASPMCTKRALTALKKQFQ